MNELLDLNMTSVEPEITFELGSYSFVNKDEIASFLSKAKQYKNILIAEESDYKASKDLRASLNKAIQHIDRHRIDKKDEMLQPINEFEKEMKELSNIVIDVKDNIDKSIKGYESEQKEAKQKQINEILEKYSEGYEVIQPKNWLNKTKSLESIEEEIIQAVKEVKQREVQKEKEISLIKNTATQQGVTADGYILSYKNGVEVFEVIAQINEAGARKRTLEQKEEEALKQKEAEALEEVATDEVVEDEPEEVKEEEKTIFDEVVYIERIEISGTKDQINELMKEMKRIGIKVAPITEN